MVGFATRSRCRGATQVAEDKEPQWERTDPAVVAAASRGSEAAFAVLYSVLGDRVRRTARRILRDEHAAEDTVQDTFVAALEHLPRLRDPVAFETWILRIARNLAVDKMRRRARCTPSAAVHSDDSEFGAGSTVVRTRWGSAEPAPPAVAVLRATYAELPSVVRETMELCYGSGLSCAAAARYLGVSRVCVRTRLCRGRQALRDAVDG